MLQFHVCETGTRAPTARACVQVTVAHVEPQGRAERGQTRGAAAWPLSHFQACAGQWGRTDPPNPGSWRAGGDAAAHRDGGSDRNRAGGE